MATLHDLVLVHIDNQPGFFARVEDITPDVKPGWWQVKLLVLTLPLQIYTWILDETQIEGAPFTMGGTPVRLEKVISPLPGADEKEVPDIPQDKATEEKKGGAKVVSLFERKKES